MKFAQLAKRFFLFGLVNILVMFTISLVLGLLRAGRFFPSGGLAGLAVFCLVWGFAGALISLALSRVMAKWFMGVRVIPPETNDPEMRQLVDMVYDLARQAGLPKPEVGIYESPEVNAFATGPSKSPRTGRGLNRTAPENGSPRARRSIGPRDDPHRKW